MKRTFWLAAGFGLGVYAGEQVRRRVVRLTPESLGDRVREVVSDAIAVGKTEMQVRERSLREAFAAPERRAPGTPGARRPAQPGR
ncbi:MAG: hypothetical protein ACKOA9_08860 [Actinomycetota bacterium]